MANVPAAVDDRAGSYMNSPFSRLAAGLRGLINQWSELLRSAPGRGWTWIRGHLPGESQHLFALTLVVGVVCGLAAVAFHLAIRAAETLLIDRAMGAPGEQWVLWTILSPTLGGLLAGLALTYVVPGATGSGVPQVKRAYATEGGRIRFRDAVGKFVVATLQIGSGASLGREGPTVQICAGATSMLGRATALPRRSLRRLTPVGVAAGIAAAFNAPIAAVTFTIEEIVGALDQTVLSGVVVAAALAAVIERGVLGAHPVIQVHHPYGLDHASSLAVYALLGLAAALISIAFTDGLLNLRRAFRTVRRIPKWAQPAIGGVVTGVLAVLVLKWLKTTGVTGGGYETLGAALAGNLSLQALLALCVIKTIATVFSYSSGGAGGIFAPSLFVGAMLGGAFGYLDVALFDHGSEQLGAFALVGMGAVFAGVIRAPITSVLIIFEMTGGYGLVLPLMLANMSSYALARRWRPTGIYDALLEQDGFAPRPSSAPPHPLDAITVADAMTSDVVCVGGDRSIESAASRLARATFACAPIVDSRGGVLGLVSLDALRRAGDPKRPVSVLTAPAHFIPASFPLARAAVRMNELGVRQLVVADRIGSSRLVGILTITDLVRAHARVAALGEAKRTSDRPGPAVRAGDFMSRPPIIPGRTLLVEVSDQLRETGALIVEAAGGYGVLLPDALGAIAGEHDLERLLVAADVTLPAPNIDENTTFEELARVMAEQDISALIVVSPATGKPVGVVTRSAVALALLDWFGTSPAPGA